MFRWCARWRTLAFAASLLIAGVACGRPASSGAAPVPASSAMARGAHGEQTVAQAAPAADITIDFGNRADQRYPIAAGMFGAGYSHGLVAQPAILAAMQAAGFVNTRLDSDMPRVFASACAATPCWDQIDHVFAALQGTGLHPILIIDYTPDWLQPSPNPCLARQLDPAHAFPTDPQQYANLAAQYVHHLDTQFPGLVQDFEIWNEPNSLDFSCVADPVERLNTYLALYAAVAPAMKNQAAADGASIQVGGPTLAGTLANEKVTEYQQYFLNGLLNDPRTAPYVDFVSYHDYIYGTMPNVTWDTSQPSLLQMTQDGQHGVAAHYAAIAQIVRNGSQPNAAATPIYITEYNTSAGGYENAQGQIISCCNNSAVYAPVWNALFVADLLIASYNGVRPPSKLVYFTSSYPIRVTPQGRVMGGACLFGDLDAKMDCALDAGAAVALYPQYYAYLLLGGTHYLDLADGGYLATSTTTARPGLVVAAFATPAQDSILIINPTGADASGLQVLVANPGPVQQTGTRFLLNASHGQIDAQSVTLTPAGAGLLATLDVPAYSVVGLALPVANATTGAAQQ